MWRTLRRSGRSARAATRAVLAGLAYTVQRPAFSPQNAVPDYEAYWQARLGDAPPRINSFQRYRADWISERTEKQASIVDLGAGPGQILVRLREMGFENLLALEASPTCLRLLEAQGIRTLEGSVEDDAVIARLPEADVFILSELLEHIANPEYVLHQVIARTREAVFFSFPNTGYWAERLRLLMGRFPAQWRLHPGEHLRFWTASDLEWWLQRLGLRDVAEVSLYEGVPGLNKVLPRLFGKAIIVRIDCAALKKS